MALAAVTLLGGALPEPPRPPGTPGSVLHGIPATIAEGVRLGGRDPLIRRVLPSAAASPRSNC